MCLIAFGVWWWLVILVAGFSRVGVWFAVWVYWFGGLLCLMLTFWVLLWLLCFGNWCVCGGGWYCYDVGLVVVVFCRLLYLLWALVSFLLVGAGVACFGWFCLVNAVACGWFIV